MDPVWRQRVLAVVVTGLALVLGWQLATGNYIWAFLGLGVLAVIALEWFGGPRPEALALGGVLVGYILGNRGFAQLSPLGNAPVFLGELALAVGLGFAVMRGAIARQVPFRRDWLNAAVLLWLAVGTLRIWHDVRFYGGSALRDFATIYYAAYFFAAQAAATHARSERWIRGCLLAAAAALPLVSLLYNLFPDFFLTQLVWRGVPLIYQKNDLVATFLFASGFMLLSQRQSRYRGFWQLAAVACFFSGLAWLSRAAMMALFAVTGAWAAARKWRPLKLLACAFALGVLVVVADAAIGRDRITDTKAYAVYEHLVSIFDVGGSRQYRNVETADSGANNRFRMVWWRTVAEETWEGNPWLGLGFGYNLAEGFLIEYGLRADDTFTARSPHSIVFTLFGRLGFVGLAALLALSSAMVSGFNQVVQTLRAGALSSRQETLAQDALGWWSVVSVIFISSLFGVVLEGPMGAVVFWTALGVANVKRRELLESVAAEAEPSEEDAASHPARAD